VVAGALLATFSVWVVSSDRVASLVGRWQSLYDRWRRG